MATPDFDEKAQGAKDILMGVAARQLKELVEIYRKGFAAYEPDADSMEEIERAASDLWHAMNDAILWQVQKELHYARRDKQFQHFMRQISQE